jgi:hypothetical protein
VPTVTSFSTALDRAVPSSIFFSFSVTSFARPSSPMIRCTRWVSHTFGVQFSSMRAVCLSERVKLS